MPTLVIPASDPWLLTAAVIDDHFIPLGSSYTPALIEAHTDITPGALTDSTGASGYLYMDIGGYEAAEFAAGGLSDGYGLGSGGGVVPTALSIPAAQVTAVRAVAVARCVSGVHEPSIVGDRLPGGSYGDGGNWAAAFYGPMSSTWTTYTANAASSLWGNPALWADFMGRVAAGAMAVEFTPSRSPGNPQGVVHVAWLAVEIDYLAAGAPPLRQFPRNDGLAGSTRRLHPAPRSRQRSIRRAGGYD